MPTARVSPTLQFRMADKRAARIWVGLFMVGGVLACDGTRGSSPVQGKVPLLSELPNSQLLFEGTRPLQAAVYNPDSLNSGIVIGRLVLAGEQGNVVGLQLEMPDYVLEAAGKDAQVTIVGDGLSSSFELSRLRLGTIVHRFARGGRVRLELKLSRRVAGVREGAVRLVLKTSAKIVSSDLPWQEPRAAIPRHPALLSHDPACAVQVGSGTCGPVNYTVVPSVPAHPIIGGTFQSTTGNGASSTIRLTFSFPVSQITTEIRDPTWSGNRMAGFNEFGVEIASVGFAFSGVPGTNTPDIQTLNGVFWRVDLIPAANDYVAYSATIVQGHQQVRVNCSPASLQRGATVNCQVSMLAPEAFTVVSRIAKAAGFTISDSPNSSHPIAGVHNWQGAAVTTTDVTVVVTAGGTTYSNSTPARFTVQPRSWAPWQLTTPMHIVQIYQRITPYPVPGASVWGYFSPILPDTAQIAISRPTEGPNKDIAFVGARPNLTDFWVVTSPALEPVPGNLKPGNPGYMPWHEWYDDQNAQPSGTCRKNSVATLRSNVLRHEGMTLVSNSHAGIANSQLSTFQPQRDIEQLFTMRTDDQLKNQVAQAILNFFNNPSGSYQQQRRQFDAIDTPLVASQGINCNFDYQRGAP